MPITEIESGFLEHFFLQKIIRGRRRRRRRKRRSRRKQNIAQIKYLLLGTKFFFGGGAKFTESFYLHSLMRHLNCIIYAVTPFVLQFLRSKYLA
jgi:hypothetical protein